MSRELPSPGRPVFSVRRDDAGVPHITAGSWLEALYGLGYMHATDRGTQLLFSRAVASGRAAERIADRAELLETDCFFRKMGLHLRLDDEVHRLDDQTFRQLTSYCAGVNAGLKERGRTLALWATGFQVDPWNQQAVLLIGQLLSFGGLAISQLQHERLLVELIHAGARDSALRALFSPRLHDVDFDLLRQVKLSNQLSDEALELISDLPRLAGSNAWAVSPQRSATGSPLLASDPHLEVNRLPAIWYEVALSWGDQYVMGASLPGCPLMAVARTPRLAWGVTYMKGDTIDFFVEDCRRGGATGWQFRRGSEWKDFALREEVVSRKGAGAQTLKILENDVGTMDDDPNRDGEGLYLSVAWAGRHLNSGIGNWLQLVSARDVTEAMDVIRECPQPTLCFVLADREGHIGLQGCGTFPRRPKPGSGLAPLPAWDAANHWQGWLPTSVLPRVYDPPEGFIATANEDINSARGPLLVTQLLPDYRLRRIREQLTDRTQITLQDMQELQYDLLSIQAREMLPVLLPHLEDGELKKRLSSWDCRYTTTSREATLYQRLYRNVIVEMLGNDRGIGWRRILYLCTRCGYSSMVLHAADRLLHRNDSWWWHGREKGEVVRRAAARMAAEPDVPWSEVNYFHFTDRFFGGHRVGRLLGFKTGRYAMPGCPATPFQGHVFQTATREQTFAPSYHFVTDLATDEAWTNLPGGASENRFSRYYRNGIADWVQGRYRRLEP